MMRNTSPNAEGSMGRLLVVDDDLVQRTIIGKIGTRLGYDTVIASTFEMASELLQREAFDIMTLDLSLGERDGVELLRLVADCKLYAMPIVIISGCEERILNSTKRVAEGLDLADTLLDQASQHRQPARRSLAARTWPDRFRSRWPRCLRSIGKGSLPASSATNSMSSSSPRSTLEAER